MTVHGREESGESHHRERRHRRFDLQFPVLLNFPSGGKVRELRTISRNVSIGGLLLKATDSLPPKTEVSFTIEVMGPRLRHPIRLQGEGQVVRVEQLETGAGFAFAIECKHPIAEIEDHFPAAG
jgi:PilZ domain